ncbi:MAG: nitroreductase family protein [Alphaproteobacteria bacterium]|nr:nitroreductase family protein [Alphaproteobacteria bacterium]
MRCVEQDSLSRRRSIYQLNDHLPVSEICFVETIEACVKHCPTPFNAQSARVAILFGKAHKLLWQNIWDSLQTVVSAKQSNSAKKKIDSFANSAGTILFFEENKTLMSLKKQFPQYAKNMRLWMQQANGMLQYMIWQTLSENEIGASLQHYNELIDKTVNKIYDLPKTWELVAQMPFGAIESEPMPKTFLPMEERVRVIK